MSEDWRSALNQAIYDAGVEAGEAAELERHMAAHEAGSATLILRADCDLCQRDPQHDLIDAHYQIVRDLAEYEAPTMYFPSGRAYCGLCQKQAKHLQGDSPLDHEPECPWRRAKALTDAGWATDPGDYEGK